MHSQYDPRPYSHEHSTETRWRTGGKCETLPSRGSLLQLCGIRRRSLAVLCGTCFAVFSGTTVAQSPPGPVSTPGTIEHVAVAAVSGNPAATTFSTGWLGRTLR